MSGVTVALPPSPTRRPNRRHRILTLRLVRLNPMILKGRAAVETTFATLKNRVGPGMIRYRGIVETKAQILLAAVAFNTPLWVTLPTPTTPHRA